MWRIEHGPCGWPKATFISARFSGIVEGSLNQAANCFSAGREFGLLAPPIVDSFEKREAYPHLEAFGLFFGHDFQVGA